MCIRCKRYWLKEKDNLQQMREVVGVEWVALYSSNLLLIHELWKVAILGRVLTSSMDGLEDNLMVYCMKLVVDR